MARLNASRLWAGGIATAVVAVLVVIAGVFIARHILNIAVLAPKAAGDFGSGSTVVTPPWPQPNRTARPGAIYGAR
jgi:hypothetical protein